MYNKRTAVWHVIAVVFVVDVLCVTGYSNTKSARVLSQPNDNEEETGSPQRPLTRPEETPTGSERDAGWKWGSNRRNSQTPQSRSDRLEQRNEYVEVEWDGLSCPKGATGAFPYAGDCRKFYNCWKGRGMLSMCAPGTLFNSLTLECDFPSKASCYGANSNGGKPSENIQDAAVAGSQNYQRAPESARPSRPHYLGPPSYQPDPINYGGHSAAYHQGRDPPHSQPHLNHHHHHHHNHGGTFHHSEAYHRQNNQYGSSINRKAVNAPTSQGGTLHSGVQPPVSNGQIPLDLTPPQPPCQTVPMYPPISNVNSDSFYRAPAIDLNNQPCLPPPGIPTYPSSDIYNHSDVSLVDSYGHKIENSNFHIPGYQPAIHNSTNDNTYTNDFESPAGQSTDSDSFGIETEGAFQGTTYEFKDGKLYLVIPVPGSTIDDHDSGINSEGQVQDNINLDSQSGTLGTNTYYGDSYQGADTDRHETVVSSTSSQSSHVGGLSVKISSSQPQGKNNNANPTERPLPNYSHRGSPGVAQPFPAYPGRKTQGPGYSSSSNPLTGYGQISDLNQPQTPDSDSLTDPNSDSLLKDGDGQQPLDDAFSANRNERGSIKFQSSSAGYDQHSFSSGYNHHTSNGGYAVQKSAGGGYRQQPSPSYGPNSGGFDRNPSSSVHSSQPHPGSDTHEQSSFDSYNQRSSFTSYNQQPFASSYNQKPAPSGGPERSPAGSRPSEGVYGQRPSDSGPYRVPAVQQPNYSQQPPRNTYSQQSPSGYGQQPSSEYGQQPNSGYGQQPSSEYGQQPNSGYGQQPNSGYGQQPNSGYGQPPNSGYSQPPNTGYDQQPTRAHGHQPNSGFGHQPSTGYGRQPANEYEQQPASGHAQKPSIGYGQPTQPNHNLQPGKSHLSSAVKPNSKLRGNGNEIPEAKCPPGFSGLAPHTNPTKFLSCVNGNAFVMDCGPGTWFDAVSQLCGFPPVSGKSNHSPEQESHVGQHSLSGDVEEVGETRSY